MMRHGIAIAPPTMLKIAPLVEVDTLGRMTLADGYRDAIAGWPGLR
jgi:hypothetical protein